MADSCPRKYPCLRCSSRRFCEFFLCISHAASRVCSSRSWVQGWSKNLLSTSVWIVIISGSSIVFLLMVFSLTRVRKCLFRIATISNCAWHLCQGPSIVPQYQSYLERSCMVTRSMHNWLPDCLCLFQFWALVFVPDISHPLCLGAWNQHLDLKCMSILVSANNRMDIPLGIFERSGNECRPVNLSFSTKWYLCVRSLWHLLPIYLRVSCRFGLRTQSSSLLRSESVRISSQTFLPRSMDWNFHLWSLLVHRLQDFFSRLLSLEETCPQLRALKMSSFFSAQHNGGSFLSIGNFSHGDKYNLFSMLCTLSFFNWTLSRSLKSRRASFIPLMLRFFRNRFQQRLDSTGNLLIQFVRLNQFHRPVPWLLLEDLQQNHNPETIQICIVVLYFPHDNIVCVHWYYECGRSTLPSVLSQARVHFVTARANLFTDQRMSSPPFLAK